MFTMVCTVLIGVGLAAPELRLAAESPFVQEDYAEHSKSKGLSFRALACSETNAELSLCFRRVKGESLPYVHRDELSKWGLTQDQALQMVKDLSQRQMKPENYIKRLIEGSDLVYFSRSNKDGWDPVALLHPKFLSQLVGGEVLVAVPASGMFVCWKNGNAERNKIMAVGIREQYQQSSHPVSPNIFQWKNNQWQVWGSAVEQQRPASQ